MELHKHFYAYDKINLSVNVSRQNGYQLELNHSKDDAPGV